MKTLQSLAELILLPYGLNENMEEVEAIKQRVLAYRQVLIQQDYSRNLRINRQLIQAFDIQLNEVVEDEDRFYISDILPKPIILSLRHPFLSVHTSYKGRTKKELGYLSVEEVPYIKYRKFTSKSDFFTFENQRIISYSKTSSIRVRAIWDDPIAAFMFAEQEVYKLACDKGTIESPCIDGEDLLLEETLAGRILSFFNNNPDRNGSNQRSQSSEE